LPNETPAASSPTQSEFIEPSGSLSSEAAGSAPGHATVPPKESPGVGTSEAEIAPCVPAHIRPLLGPAWVDEKEDSQRYEGLLAEVGKAVGAVDVVDWLWVKTAVDRQFAAERARSQSESQVRLGFPHALEQVLEPISYSVDRKTNFAALLAREYHTGETTHVVDSSLKRAGLSVRDVYAQSLTNNAVELERLDLQSIRHETLRDKAIEEAEKRRLRLAKQDRRNESIEAEYTDVSNPTRSKIR
jgi:hypothetical protein